MLRHVHLVRYLEFINDLEAEIVRELNTSSLCALAEPGIDYLLDASAAEALDEMENRTETAEQFCMRPLSAINFFDPRYFNSELMESLRGDPQGLVNIIQNMREHVQAQDLKQQLPQFLDLVRLLPGPAHGEGWRCSCHAASAYLCRCLS